MRLITSRLSTQTFVFLTALLLCLAYQFQSRDSFADQSSEAATPRPATATLEEAQIRARILHSAIDGALQVMHRDHFRESDSRHIPSRSLDDVFEDLAEKHQVTLRWLTVNANSMSSDHDPQNDFEKAAAKAIASGQTEYESVEDQTYHFAGMIRLSASCLKCHVPLRKSLEDRFSGLLISMPYHQ